MDLKEEDKLLSLEPQIDQIQLMRKYFKDLIKYFSALRRFGRFDRELDIGVP